ncbi:MAG: hypothetical protein HY763_13050 [Planctomycetes bacterium]|nr:hypothetical protein [Planctomycetota bacterium]
MLPIQPDHPLRRHFAGLVEHAFFTEIGMCDPELTDYVADLLVSFTHIDRLNAIRHARGKRLDQIAAMLIVLADEKPGSAAERDRSIYRNIGDYTLFWAGMYPEHLRRSSHVPSDVLLDYVAQGKRSYAIVADLSDEDYQPPPTLFRSLSDDFESCLHGLGLVRRCWEQAETPPATPGGELLY